ncbi:hypothetical protein [Amycolatopsis sp. cmx-4-68]|uniref:hypothetical protein n=1 Tax=Amycolatopsis sp. cmx-4-68 TaxID=2790938 RepID=UPI00397CF9FA
MKDPTLRTFAVFAVALAATIAYAFLGRGVRLTEGAFVFFLAMAGQVAERWADRTPSRAGSWGIATAVVSFGGGAALAVAMLVSGARAYPLSWLALLAVSGLCLWLTRKTGSFVPALYATPVLADLLSDGRQPHQFTGWLIAYVTLAWVGQAIAVVQARTAGRERPPPGEPTRDEIAATRLWLYRHHVLVRVPTRLIALRVGARQVRLSQTPSRTFLVVGASWAVAVGLSVALDIAMTDGPLRGHPDVVRVGVASLLTTACTVSQLVHGRMVRRREEAIERPTGLGARRPRRSVRLLGGGYLASVGLTFAAGLPLYCVLFAAAPAVPTGVALAILTVGAVVTGRNLAKLLTAPVLAEDRSSGAVDRLLRVQDAHAYASPAPYAAFAVLSAWPAAVPLQLTYGVLAVGAQLTGWLLYRDLALPRGRYEHQPAAPPAAPGGAAGGELSGSTPF